MHKKLINLSENQEIGIDIVDIERFRKKQFLENGSFYEKIFTKISRGTKAHILDDTPNYNDEILIYTFKNIQFYLYLILNVNSIYRYSFNPRIYLSYLQ